MNTIFFIVGAVLTVLMVTYLATRKYRIVPITKKMMDARLMGCVACGAPPRHLCLDKEGKPLMNHIHEVRWVMTDEKLSYELIETPDAVGGWAIKCRRCGLTSYHPKDVEHRFCANCNIFHNDLKVVG